MSTGKPTQHNEGNIMQVYVVMSVEIASDSVSAIAVFDSEAKAKEFADEKDQLNLNAYFHWVESADFNPHWGTEI